MTLRDLRDGIDAMTKAVDATIETLPHGDTALREASRIYLRTLRETRASYEKALTFRIDCGEKEASDGEEALGGL
jgi:hypothetical protein